MKRMRYDAKVKAAILTAVHEARKSGKPWAEAFESAKQAGYKGNVDSLTQLVRSSSKTKKTSTVKKAKARSPVAAPAVTTPAVKSSSSNLDITALVHKAVTDAVVSALEGLVVRIKSGK